MIKTALFFFALLSTTVATADCYRFSDNVGGDNISRVELCYNNVGAIPADLASIEIFYKNQDNSTVIHDFEASYRCSRNTDLDLTRQQIISKRHLINIDWNYANLIIYALYDNDTAFLSISNDTTGSLKNTF